MPHAERPLTVSGVLGVRRAVVVSARKRARTEPLRTGQPAGPCAGMPKIVRLPAGASVARGKHSGRGYWREWGRSLKIRMPRYLFIHACLCG